MIKNSRLSPETTREIISLADDMSNLFSPPELLPGCVVMSITDKDQYADGNGWIEAICGKHNQQRVRWRGQFQNIQLGDYVDVLYFKSIRLFTTMGRGGTAQIPQPPLLNTTFFLHTEAADVATYEQLLTTPSDDTEVIDNVSLVAGDGEVLIDAYVSYPTTGLGTTLLEAGTWEFHIFGRVDTVVGTNTIVCRVYKRTSGGVETELFSVETTALTTTVAEKIVSSVQTDVFIDSTDRLVAKFYAKTTSVASRTIYLYYEGTNNYTHFHTPIDIVTSAFNVWPRASQANIDNVAYVDIDNFFDALTNGTQGIIGEWSTTTDFAGGHATIPTGADVKGSGIDATLLTSADTTATLAIAGETLLEQCFVVNTYNGTNGVAVKVLSGGNARIDKVYGYSGSATNNIGFYLYDCTALLINCEAYAATGSNNYAVWAYDNGSGTAVTIRGGYFDGDVVADQAGTTIHLDGPTITGSVTQANGGTITGHWYDASGNLLPQDKTKVSRLVASDGAPDPALSADASGYLSSAVQPLFSAYNSVTDTNVTGDGTAYAVIFDTEITDVGGHYNNATGVFTAPVAGSYLLIGSITIQNISSSHTQGRVVPFTTGRAYVLGYSNPYVGNSGGLYTYTISLIADMAATDVSYMQIQITGGTKTVSAFGGAAVYTYFQGYLLI